MIASCRAVRFVALNRSVCVYMLSADSFFTFFSWQLIIFVFIIQKFCFSALARRGGPEPTAFSHQEATEADRNNFCRKNDGEKRWRRRIQFRRNRGWRRETSHTRKNPKNIQNPIEGRCEYAFSTNEYAIHNCCRAKHFFRSFKCRLKTGPPTPKTPSKAAVSMHFVKLYLVYHLNAQCNYAIYNCCIRINISFYCLNAV